MAIAGCLDQIYLIIDGDLNCLDQTDEQTKRNVHVQTQPRPAPKVVRKTFSTPYAPDIWNRCNPGKQKEACTLYEIQHGHIIHLHAYFVPHPCHI